MTKAEKRLDAIRRNPCNVPFDLLTSVAERLGFVLVSKGGGSHRQYRHPGPPAQHLTLTPRNDGKAKAYQVREFLNAVDVLFGEEDL